MNINELDAAHKEAMKKLKEIEDRFDALEWAFHMSIAILSTVLLIPVLAWFVL